MIWMVARKMSLSALAQKIPESVCVPKNQSKYTQIFQTALLGSFVSQLSIQLSISADYFYSIFKNAPQDCSASSAFKQSNVVLYILRMPR
jgi:hypothetical protein